MKNNLLNKTLKTYILSSLIIAIISAPSFYYIIKHIQKEEAEEMLEEKKYQFLQAIKKDSDKFDINNWNNYNFDIKILNEPCESSSFKDIDYPNLSDGDLEPFKVLYAPLIINNHHYTLSIRISLLDAEDTLFYVMLTYSIVILLILSSLFIISNYYSKRLWQPFRDLLQQLEVFELGSAQNIQFSKTDIDEFLRLFNVIENLLERSQTIYKTQKEFVENAAHELQTPLAIMRAKLDNLAQGEINHQDAASIEALNNALERLTHLNKNILLLSRIENDQYPLNDTIVISEAVKDHCEFLTEQINSLHITLKTSFNEDFTIETNKALFEICLSNLLTNAIKHNHSNGSIFISVSKNTLQISNSSALSALNVNHLFSRFQKNHNSNGNGLGLSISKKIADLNHWKIEYRYDQNLHHFSIQF